MYPLSHANPRFHRYIARAHKSSLSARRQMVGTFMSIRCIAIAASDINRIHLAGMANWQLRILCTLVNDDTYFYVKLIVEALVHAAILHQ